jgi:hypothetical protein
MEKEGGEEEEKAGYPTPLLQTSLAIPNMLKPKTLADSVTVILAEVYIYGVTPLALRTAHHMYVCLSIWQVYPHALTREQFILCIGAVMTAGLCPPLNQVLSTPALSETRRKSSLQRDPFAALSTEERELVKVTGKPHLTARRVTEEYMRGRQRMRDAQNKSHSDIIYECTYVCLCLCMDILLIVCDFVCDFVCHFVCLFVIYMSVYMSVYMHIYVYVHIDVHYIIALFCINYGICPPLASLLDKDLYAQRLCARKRELEEDAKRGCPFQPQLATRPDAVQYWRSQAERSASRDR